MLKPPDYQTFNNTDINTKNVLMLFVAAVGKLRLSLME